MVNKNLIFPDCKTQYDIVLRPNYYMKKAYEEMRDEIREIIISICERENVDIIEGKVHISCVCLTVEFPLELNISDFVRRLEVASTGMIFRRHPDLRDLFPFLSSRKFWEKVNCSEIFNKRQYGNLLEGEWWKEDS